MLKILFLLCFVSFSLATSSCRTRSAEELGKTSPARVVFTPFVRKGSAVSNTFFGAAEFAGLLGDRRSLPDVLQCIITPPEEVGSHTSFIATTTGITTEIIPASHDCYDKNGIGVTNLRDVSGELFVVAHGNAKNPRIELGFGPGGIEGRVEYSPDELAELLVKEGMACDQKKVTLIFLTGGMELSNQAVDKRYLELYRKMQATKDENKHVKLVEEWGDLAIRARDPKAFEANLDLEDEIAPFATLFALALNQRGYLDVTVTGFRAPVRTRIGLNPTNPGPYAGLQVEITSKRLATRYCRRVSKSASDIQKCADRLIAPCDECLLANSKAPIAFIQRLKLCRQALRRGNVEQRRSAAICRAHTAFVTRKWTFSVHGGDAASMNENLD